MDDLLMGRAFCVIYARGDGLRCAVAGGYWPLETGQRIHMKICDQLLKWWWQATLTQVAGRHPVYGGIDGNWHMGKRRNGSWLDEGDICGRNRSDAETSQGILLRNFANAVDLK